MVDVDHGRIEIRTARVGADICRLQDHHDRPGLQAIAPITATREIDGVPGVATRHYIFRLAILRRIALSITGAETSKGPMRGKLIRAG